MIIINASCPLEIVKTVKKGWKMIITIIINAKLRERAFLIAFLHFIQQIPCYRLNARAWRGFLLHGLTLIAF